MNDAIFKNFEFLIQNLNFNFEYAALRKAHYRTD